MASLGAIMTRAVVHYRRDEFLQRLSHPFWFQSLGTDWRSSGITSVIGALKRGLAPCKANRASMSAAAAARTPAAR
jgi:hypothetical protein